MSEHITPEDVIKACREWWPDVGVITVDYSWTKTDGASYGLMVGPPTRHRFAASADSLPALYAKLTDRETTNPGD